MFLDLEFDQVEVDKILDKYRNNPGLYTDKIKSFAKITEIIKENKEIQQKENDLRKKKKEEK